MSFKRASTISVNNAPLRIQTHPIVTVPLLLDSVNDLGTSKSQISYLPYCEGKWAKYSLMKLIRLQTLDRKPDPQNPDFFMSWHFVNLTYQLQRVPCSSLFLGAFLNFLARVRPASKTQTSPFRLFLPLLSFFAFRFCFLSNIFPHWEDLASIRL